MTAWQKEDGRGCGRGVLVGRVTAVSEAERVVKAAGIRKWKSGIRGAGARRQESGKAIAGMVSFRPTGKPRQMARLFLFLLYKFRIADWWNNSAKFL